MSNENTKQKRQQSDLTLDEILGANMQVAEQLAGSYPAYLAGFSEPYVLEGKYGAQTKFDALLVVKGKETQTIVRYTITVPTGAIHPKSNLYKLIAALDSGKFVEANKFKDGFKLSDAKGKLNVEIEEKNDFPRIVAVASPMDGLTYPTEQDSMELLESIS